jgi:hypothetical protein
MSPVAHVSSVREALGGEAWARGCYITFIRRRMTTISRIRLMPPPP